MSLVHGGNGAGPSTAALLGAAVLGACTVPLVTPALAFPERLIQPYLTWTDAAIQATNLYVPFVFGLALVSSIALGVPLYRALFGRAELTPRRASITGAGVGAVLAVGFWLLHGVRNLDVLGHSLGYLVPAALVAAQVTRLWLAASRRARLAVLASAIGFVALGALLLETSVRLLEEPFRRCVAADAERASAGERYWWVVGSRRFDARATPDALDRIDLGAIVRRALRDKLGFGALPEREPHVAFATTSGRFLYWSFFYGGFVDGSAPAR